MLFSSRAIQFSRSWLAALLCSLLTIPVGLMTARISNSKPRKASRPVLKITKIPPKGNGREKLDDIEGTVSGPYPSDAWVLVYSCVKLDCFIQQTDQEVDYRIPIHNGAWKKKIHLGDHYYALLVTGNFTPDPNETCPPVRPNEKGVLARTDEQPPLGLTCTGPH
jgi:hypothetical protein